MSDTEMKVLTRHADNLRFILDAVCAMTDERNSDDLRIEASEELIDCDHLYKVACECREAVRNIANIRTDTM